MDSDFLSVMENPIALLLLMQYGFKFQPSDEELFSKYLVPKTRGDILKGFPMGDVNLCEHEPWDLPGKSIINVAGQVAWYFFCPRDLRGKGHRRKTKAGNWKPTSNTKSIMAEGTENEIGVMRALRFYEGQVRTGWMIYEFDLVSEPSLFEKGQYVLCKLEFNSEGVKSKKRKRSHRIAPVSRSEVEPSQSMDSDSENINPSEMAVNSPCDESGLSYHVGLHFGNQNSGEMMNSSARQLSESSHHRTSEFRNQNSNNLMSNLVHDRSGSSHSTVFNRENQYWNQPTVDSAYNGNESPYTMAFDSETQTPNELLAADSAYKVSRKHGMAFDLANQNPNVPLTADSASNFVSESRYMALDLANQNPNVLLTDDNVASNVSERHCMGLNWENKNLCNSISILTCENSLMASRGSEIQEPPFPFPPVGESGNSMVMPSSIINQSTYDKSEPSSLISSDFDYQNLSKEIDISAFDEGVWSNITATPPDFVYQNPCKKPDMSALEEVYSSYSESFLSDRYLADLALPELSPGLQAEIERCFEQEPNVPLTDNNSASNVSESHYMALDWENKNLCNSISILTCENSLMASRGSEIQEPPFPFPPEGESGNSMVMSSSIINQSTYDKSEPSSLISSDFDYQNLSKEIDISAFDEGVWSNITATPLDFVYQNPCKKPDMSAALEEVYSSSSESFLSDRYLADLALPEVTPGLQAEMEGCFEQENIPSPALVQLPAFLEENHSFMGL